jgi:hypothetical protein
MRQQKLESSQKRAHLPFLVICFLRPNFILNKLNFLWPFLEDDVELLSVSFEEGSEVELAANVVADFFCSKDKSGALFVDFENDSLLLFDILTENQTKLSI